MGLSNHNNILFNMARSGAITAPGSEPITEGLMPTSGSGNSFGTNLAGDPITLDTIGSVDPNNPDEAAAQITRGRMDLYQQLYEPALVETINSLGDTSIFDDAGQDARDSFRTQRQATNRDLRRYNMVGGLPPAVRKGMQNQRRLERSLGIDSAENNARTTLADRNTALRDNLVNIFNGVSASSASGLDTAVSNQYSREAANAQARASDRAQTYSTIGTLATMAAIIAM
jgi:hypothetical protein